METLNIEQERRNLSFIDVTFLEAFGKLNRNNILDYFYLSPFYDPLTNNQIIRTQGVSPDHLVQMTGLEFGLHSNPFEPELFVIEKRIRRSPFNVEVVEVYYYVDGTIYQSPILLDLLTLRYQRIVRHLNAAFNISVDDLQYSTNQGHKCFQTKTSFGNINENSNKVIIKSVPSFSTVLSDLEVYINKLQK